MNGRTNSNNNSTMTILGDGIPLDPPSSFLCEARNSKVDITWVDPKDKYATPEGEQMEDTDQLISVWSYTKIVRKEGSQPTSPSDGVTVCTNTTRNQYQSTIFEDTSVTNGVTYYYAAYAYNTAGTYSDGAFSDGITPIEWDPVLANNSWEQIDSACTQGVAQSIWNVGDEKSVNVNNVSTPFIIVAFNMINLSDNSGVSAIVFSTKNAIVIPEKIFPNNPGNAQEMEWTDSSAYSYIINQLPSLVDSNVYQYMNTVNMKHAHFMYEDGESISDALVRMTQYTCKIFGFTSSEMINNSQVDGYGQLEYYATASNRCKKRYSQDGTEHTTGPGFYVLAETLAEEHPADWPSRPSYSSGIGYINATSGGYSTTFGDYLGECATIYGFCIGKSNG